jgi:2,5-diketo-D-gluconate reductase A
MKGVASMSEIPNVTLNNGVQMPQLGFGVFQIPEAETTAAVTAAFEAGYRSIDTAAGYRNEAAVGRAIAQSGLPREEVFVTTKLANPDQGHESALRAFDKSIGLLGLEYVDLYLIHWPIPKLDRYVETWRALEKLYADGRIRAIGVSNFQPSHLERLGGGVVPAVNQIELHPYLTQDEVRAYDAEHGIVTEAWSPLAKGGELLADPVVTALAEKYGRTPAQIVLRWHLQRDTVVIPKSVTPSRIKENADIFDFSLDDADVAQLSGLDRGYRTGPHPDTFGA